VILPASPYTKESIKSALAGESNAAWFFGYRGIAHYEFAPEVQRVNQEFHLVVLRRLWDDVQRKTSEMWAIGSWLLQHDNAHAHTALSVPQFFVEH
jgi:hypothetical protein